MIFCFHPACFSFSTVIVILHVVGWNLWPLFSGKTPVYAAYPMRPAA
jgi:hypothetical protein